MLKTPALFSAAVYIKNYGKNDDHPDSFFVIRDNNDIRVTIKFMTQVYGALFLQCKRGKTRTGRDEE